MRTEQATLGGGCFWCLDAVYRQFQGVTDVVSGYAGGTVADPGYALVCTGTTGHAEVVRITYDPAVIGYRDLLDVFFTIHDPTERDRQGGDIGTQYRSVIFYHDAAQRQVAEQAMADVAAAGWWEGDLVTQLDPAPAFYPAETSHQDYFTKNPEWGYCRAVVAPKVAKARKTFVTKLRLPTAAEPGP